jgi:hypothetical protein
VYFAALYDASMVMNPKETQTALSADDLAVFAAKMFYSLASRKPAEGPVLSVMSMSNMDSLHAI